MHNDVPGKAFKVVLLISQVATRQQMLLQNRTWWIISLWKLCRVLRRSRPGEARPAAILVAEPAGRSIAQRTVMPTGTTRHSWASASMPQHFMKPMPESRPQLADSSTASQNLVVIECQGHFSSIARDIIINMLPTAIPCRMHRVSSTLRQRTAGSPPNTSQVSCFSMLEARRLNNLICPSFCFCQNTLQEESTFKETSTATTNS